MIHFGKSDREVSLLIFIRLPNGNGNGNAGKTKDQLYSLNKAFRNFYIFLT